MSHNYQENLEDLRVRVMSIYRESNDLIESISDLDKQLQMDAIEAKEPEVTFESARDGWSVSIPPASVSSVTALRGYGCAITIEKRDKTKHTEDVKGTILEVMQKLTEATQ